MTDRRGTIFKSRLAPTRFKTKRGDDLLLGLSHQGSLKREFADRCFTLDASRLCLFDTRESCFGVAELIESMVLRIPKRSQSAFRSKRVPTGQSTCGAMLRSWQSGRARDDARTFGTEPRSRGDIA